MMNFLRKLEPTTLVFLTVGLVVLALLAIFGGERIQIAIAGAIGIVATAFAKSLVKPSALERDDDGDGSNGPAALIVVALVALASLGVDACASALTPAQQKDLREGVTVVDTGCKFIGAVTNDGASNAICATATELGDIASAVFAMHASALDAGASPHFARGETCTTIPGTTVCATALELSMAIDTA